MLVIGLIALVLGWLLRPDSTTVGLSAAIIGVAFIVFGVVVILRIVELIVGVTCPGCGEKRLERRFITSFGERFYLCPDCGVRCRRSLFGLLGPFFWNDAAGPEFDAHYQKPKAEDPWNAPPGLEDDDEIVISKTHANLVKNKRLRRPDNPNGPGLE
jgi:predicted RNA-binding Zn-ribbon protein involved in translation (DUF1610 family)